MPRYVWRKVPDMTNDLGSPWPEERDKFYPFVSVEAHTGSFILASVYGRLSRQEAPSDFSKATVLVTALVCHLRVATIAAECFPEEIDAEDIADLDQKSRLAFATVDTGD